MAGLEEILARLLVPDNAVIQQVCVLERLKLKLSSAVTGHCLLAMPSCFKLAGMKNYAMLCFYKQNAVIILITLFGRP